MYYNNFDDFHILQTIADKQLEESLQIQEVTENKMEICKFMYIQPSLCVELLETSKNSDPF